MSNKRKKPDRRAYTFMVIPHRGDKTYSISFPINTIKKTFIGLGCLLTVFAGIQLNHLYIVNQAKAEQVELSELRANKDVQEEKIKNLAQITESMQEEMLKVNQLENDVRRSLGTEDGAVSRSGVDRRMPGQTQAHQTAQLEKLSIDEIMMRTNSLKDVAVNKQSVLSNLNNQLVERNTFRDATPSIWPASGEVTSRFGSRNSPGGMGSSFHKGLDIAGAYGTPIYATATGTIEIASWYYGYGLYVQIDHGYSLKTAYGHCSSLAVKPGQHVTKGEVIAYMGNSGVSTGTHVHYEVIKNGTQVNPANFL